MASGQIPPGRSRLLDVSESFDDEVRGMLEEWISPLESSGTFRPKLTMTLAWAYRCSPPSARASDVALAVLDLGLWISFLDDYDGADWQELFEQCEGVLGGAQAASAPHPMIPLFGRLHGLMRGCPVSLTRYVALRKELLAAYRVRNTITEISYSDYYDLRRTTIGIRMWYSVWEVLCGRVLADDVYELDSVDETIETVVRWHVLQNEVRSLSRDRASGTPNLVDLRVHERGDDDVRAVVSECRDEAEALMGRFLELGARLASNPETSFVSEVLDACIVGAIDLYSKNFTRYSSDP